MRDADRVAARWINMALPDCANREEREELIATALSTARSHSWREGIQFGIDAVSHWTTGTSEHPFEAGQRYAARAVKLKLERATHEPPDAT